MSKLNRALRSFMETSITSAAMRHWTPTIFLRTQREYQEENFGARNPAALWVGRYRGRGNAASSSFRIKPRGTSIERHWLAAFAHLVFLPYHSSATQHP